MASSFSDLPEQFDLTLRQVFGEVGVSGSVFGADELVEDASERNSRSAFVRPVAGLRKNFRTCIFYGVRALAEQPLPESRWVLHVRRVGEIRS